MSRLKAHVVLAVSFVASFASVPAAAAIVPGRIAISSDGNRHDCDDIFSTAVTIAILGKTGNADRLTYYGYADHVWSSETGCAEGNRELAMQRSAVGTALLFGGFDPSVFINARANRKRAIQKLTEEINASSPTDPLWILAAGPMHVIGTALNHAASSRRQYVTVVSHSKWNDWHATKPQGGESPHTGWTWRKIRKMTSPPRLVHLPDQNAELKARQWEFSEWRESVDARLRWLWTRNEATGLPAADCSDAGMTYWLATGRENRAPSAEDVKDVLR